jgi:protocatechuate 3,4-dioxygenase beta subunit
LKPTDLTRRTAFGLMAASPLIAAPLSACAATRPTQAETGSIVLMPQSVEGPYYFDPSLERRDISEDRTGIPVTLALRVLRADGQALSNARVDVWHCDAQGRYSGYEGQGGNRETDTRGRTFLRGTQFSSADGNVAFNTIYPGWYHGRTAHIHFKVFLDQNTVLTAQTYFPDALSEYLYQNAPAYARAALRDTLNANDSIAQDATRIAFAHIKEDADRYLISLTIGVDPNARGASGDQRGAPPAGQPPIGGPPPGASQSALAGAARVAAILPGAG